MEDNKPEAPVYTTPYTVIIDTSEQLPWEFTGLTKRIDGAEYNVNVQTETSKLKTGDYSIAGYETGITIERKSKEDLVKTIAHGRERFERELYRMTRMKVSAVIVDSEWIDCMRYCGKETQFNPRALDNTIIAWSQRFPTTHWFYRPSRFTAAATAWKLFERYLRDMGEMK